MGAETEEREREMKIEYSVFFVEVTHKEIAKKYYALDKVNSNC